MLILLAQTAQDDFARQYWEIFWQSKGPLIIAIFVGGCILMLAIGVALYVMRHKIRRILMGPSSR